MRSKPTRRGLFAVLLAVLFPALAIHVSCVAVLGPGTWGSGMEEKVPELRPAASNPAVEPYAREFRASETGQDNETARAEPQNSLSEPEDATESHTAAPQAELPPAGPQSPAESENPLTEAALAGLQTTLAGKVFWTDRLESENLTLIATHEGPTWGENQHFYLRQGSGEQQDEQEGKDDQRQQPRRPKATRERRPKPNEPANSNSVSR
jgi:hypothetical protein